MNEVAHDLDLARNSAAAHPDADSDPHATGPSAEPGPLRNKPNDRQGTTRLRYPLVQTLRGVAAIWVVLYHAGAAHHIDALRTALPVAIDEVLFQAGHLGVAIFFALSGFVIAHNVHGVKADIPFLGRFILRRCVRLDPPYWVSIGLAIALSVLAASVQHRPTDNFSVGRIVAHLFYLQEILGYPEINSAYWTLTYEIQFYLIFAAALTASHFLAAHGRPSGAIWGLLYLAALINAAGLMPFERQGIFLNLWASFYVGTLAYRATHAKNSLLPFVVLAFTMFAPIGAPERNLSFGMTAAATAILLFMSLRWDALQTWADKPCLQWLGMISYSLYLMHNPVTGATAYLTRHLLGTSVAADTATLWAILAASIGSAAFLWWAVERPAHRLSRSTKRLFG